MIIVLTKDMALKVMKAWTQLNILERTKYYWRTQVMDEHTFDFLKAKHTLSCSSSSFCSKSIISDFPCCSARKLKNCLHLTRTSENWSCSNTEQFINDQIIILHLNHTVSWTYQYFIHRK